MTKTTTTYALPDEPEGPVWDKDGKRWTSTDVDGWWLRDVTGVQCRWAHILEGYGPVTSTPPWTPEVGGIVETAEQYAAMPEGSIVASSAAYPYVRGGGANGDYWFGIGCEDKFSDLYMKYVSRTILRVGWES